MKKKNKQGTREKGRKLEKQRKEKRLKRKK
jgi:hypothetical protein